MHIDLFIFASKYCNFKLKGGRAQPAALPPGPVLFISEYISNNTLKIYQNRIEYIFPLTTLQKK